jgi:hypothetical protein
MKFTNKLIRGDDCRKTRFHDEKGNGVSFDRFMRNGFRAFATGLDRIIFGFRPKVPWISYDACRVIEDHLAKCGGSVLEFGSGMSTVWYARHSSKVISIEDYAPWKKKVDVILSSCGVGNVEYIYADSVADYSDPLGDRLDTFDLIVIDGSHRDLCVAHSLRRLKAGGVIYLENSDKDSGFFGGAIRGAERLLLQFAELHGYEVRYFTDYAPTQFIPTQGMMVLSSR